MQLYHDALLLPQCLGFVRDRRCNSIMTPYCFLDAWDLFLIDDATLSRRPTASLTPGIIREIPLSEGKNAWVLQSSIHNEALNSARALTLGQRLIEGQTRWGTVTKVPGEFCFTDCYWEWLELVVGRNTRLLYSTRLYGVVTTSLYTYDRNSDVVRAFCEAWCPSTNTLHTMAGELSTTQWVSD
ncbi:putative mitochondrial protein [Cucumis melo var. makuwa]|uniref:Putative mitochondrial protein n=1 Tax=Cucumis melo var. makuwa TaxID=1194695 RepID=A0A5D3DE12_CUCMM|nr:putative mitochondrial protein [Cucumis melo var. makuwa]